jgi:N-acetylglucosaminyldiphosphoundecaprenol N-acetyl-beta-D-mannosaminyltransferase
MIKELDILGVKISKITKEELLSLAQTTIRERKRLKLFTVNNEFIVDAQANKDYREILNKSDISVADSTGVVWSARKLHNEKIERLPGADLFFDLLDLADKEKRNVFFFGGTKGVGELAKGKVEKRYPNIQIGVIDGVKISAEDESKSIIDKINETDPAVVFVALGSPKQEMWIENNLSKLKPAIYVGVGGTLDFVSGKIKRAPQSIRGLGLEWLYRLIVQPSRAKRIYKAVVTFPLLINKVKRT